MVNWSEGYFLDTNYTFGFFDFLSPTHLRYAALAAGIDISDRADFNYCELAFGQGVTANVLAACFPEAQFWGTDFNPNQVAFAQKLASKAGLTNTHWFDDSFAEFCERDTPEFDFICLHGIYSWISQENQQKIVEFINKKLKLGGIVFISYNCLPHWAVKAPTRQFFYEAYQISDPKLSVTERVMQSLDFMDNMADKGIGHFKANPKAVEHIKSLRNANPNYLAHEYLNENWYPLYFSNVATDLENAKLRYAGSSDLIDYITNIHFSEEVAQLIFSQPNTNLRETLRDIASDKGFRRDIFVKGDVHLTFHERNERFKQMKFLLLRPVDQISLTFTTQLGEVTLPADIYQPILRALASGEKTAAELLTLSDKHTLPILWEAMLILSGLNHVTPLAADPIPTAAAKRFNDYILSSSEWLLDINYLVSSKIGSACVCSHISRLFAGAYQQKKNSVDQLTAHALSVFKQYGYQLNTKDKVLTQESEIHSELKKMAQSFLDNELPLLQQLEII